jgi:hypothetical protein
MKKKGVSMIMIISIGVKGRMRVRGNMMVLVLEIGVISKNKPGIKMMMSLLWLMMRISKRIGPMLNLKGGQISMSI